MNRIQDDVIDCRDVGEAGEIVRDKLIPTQCLCLR